MAEQHSEEFVTVRPPRSNFPSHDLIMSTIDSGHYQIIEWRGKPLAIRVDNGPEYISSTLVKWAEKQGIALNYIRNRPASPL